MTVKEERFDRTQQAGAAVYAVRRLTEQREILPYLEAHRPYAAYALAQLEPAVFASTSWWLASADGGSAIVLHSAAGLGQALWVLGDPAALDVALSLHPGPFRTFATLKPEHFPAVDRHFRLARQQRMFRMRVTAETFAPVSGDAFPLLGRDAERLNRLYRSEGTLAFYRPSDVSSGVYRGIEAKGRLVAVAGTHAISTTYGIAVVGNVFTHPRWRGRGLATAATSAVTAELLRSCREVILSVETTNEPALQAYRKLGYREVDQLIESAAIRRDALGLSSFLRRTAAHFRGGRRGPEVVSIAHSERKRL